jgi:phage baseplate assembly protein W
MPIQQTTQVNPLDLQPNVAIGVSLPFNGPSGPFNKTYSTKDQTKYNLINLLLTNKSERLFNPQFGCDLQKVLFEGINSDSTALIESLITTNVNYFIPEITIQQIVVDNDEDHNTISITVNYYLTISGTPDQVTVQFI